MSEAPVMFKLPFPPSHRTLSLAPARQCKPVSSFRPMRHKLNTPGVATHILLPKYRRQARLVKINRILLHVDHLLSKEKWSEAWYYFYSKLEPTGEREEHETGKRGRSNVEASLNGNSDRFNVFENAVSLFAGYHRFDEALEIHDRMRGEGFVPSLSLRTKITACTLIREQVDADMLFKTLEEEAFRHAAYDEKALFQLIRFLGDTMSFSPTSINHIVELWSKHHGTISSTTTLAYLVHLHARNGILEAAQDWLQVHANEAAERGQAPSPVPYTSFLSTLARIRPRPNEELLKTITRMQKDGVAPDLPVFNALISSQIAHNQLGKAFQTYNLLYESRGRSLVPDSFTFSSLFKAISRCRRRPVPSEATAETKIRDLYSNLLECHLIQTKGRLTTRSPALNPSVLNHALQMFMTCNDYPGAYVVLQSFMQCNLPANAGTCRVVVKTLLHRVKKEFRLYSGNISRTWSGRYLGYQGHGGVDGNENVLTFSDEQIMDKILLRAQNPQPSMSIVPQNTGRAPVVEQSLLRPAVFSNKMELGCTLSHLDLVLLKRIVQRAFLLDFTNQYHIAYQLDNESIRPMKSFSSAIVAAKCAMIPNIPSLKRYFKN